MKFLFVKSKSRQNSRVSHFQIIFDMHEIKKGEYLAVCTEETPCSERARARGIDPIPVFWDSGDISGPERLKGQHRGMALQMHLSSYLVQLGYNTIVQDVDSMWMKGENIQNQMKYFLILDPRPAMLELSKVEGSDLIAMWAPSGGLIGPTNTGFVFLSNRRTSYTPFLKDFMKTLVNVHPPMIVYSDSATDQAIWNVLIKHDSFDQVNVRILPREQFFALRPGDKRPDNILDVAYVVHFVAAMKRERMEKLGVWYLDGERELDEWEIKEKKYTPKDKE